MPALVSMGEDTVMVPAWLPPPPVVLIVTLLPNSSAFWIWVAKMLVPELGPELVGYQVPPVAGKGAGFPVVAFALIWTFNGSSNHSPAWPKAAVVSTFAPSTSSQCPEVSTRPPLPPLGPPLALKVP